MVAVITGDIINSRVLKNQNIWIKPLTNLFNNWGKNPKNWEIYRGDNFQLELNDPYESLSAAFYIKALIKSLDTGKTNNRKSAIDVRMAIGIGSKNFEASRISESNGTAFVFSGEKFEKLKSEKLTIAVKSDWKDFDKEINLYLKLAAIQIDDWSISSAELMKIILDHPGKTQAQIGSLLGIEQNSVSGRWSRANAEEILEVEKMFREKLRKQLL